MILKKAVLFLLIAPLTIFNSFAAQDDQSSETFNYAIPLAALAAVTAFTVADKSFTYLLEKQSNEADIDAFVNDPALEHLITSTPNLPQENLPVIKNILREGLKQEAHRTLFLHTFYSGHSAALAKICLGWLEPQHYNWTESIKEKIKTDGCYKTTDAVWLTFLFELKRTQDRVTGPVKYYQELLEKRYSQTQRPQNRASTFYLTCKNKKETKNPEMKNAVDILEHTLRVWSSDILQKKSGNFQIPKTPLIEKYCHVACREKREEKEK